MTSSHIAQQFCITTRNKYQAQAMQDPGDSIDALQFSYVSVFLIVNNLDIYTFYSNIVTRDMYFLSCEE